MYIQVGVERLPICRECWGELAESDVEWSEEGLKSCEEKANQDGVKLENEQKTVKPNKQKSQREAQNEPDAGEKFIEELSRTMGSK